MTRLRAGRARPATNRPGASTSPLPDRVRPLAEASGPTLNAGEVVGRLRDFRIVAGGHRIEQPRLCAVDVIGRALPHRLPGSVCPFQLSPPRSRRVPPRISETRPNPAESPPPLYQPRQNDQHPVRVLFLVEPRWRTPPSRHPSNRRAPTTILRARSSRLALASPPPALRPGSKGAGPRTAGRSGGSRKVINHSGR